MRAKEKEYEALIQELRAVADTQGIRIRFEKGDFNGGYCVLKTEKVIVINKSASQKRKANVLALALKEIGIEDIYVNPKIREMIEEN
ncbi:MAG: hypothetical protein FJ213_00490 [Ignavibacteria bacterium]|nr:hypothetical protein [Ignavibacteria bacterium]